MFRFLKLLIIGLLIFYPYRVALGSEQIPLYLPYQSSQFPELSVRFDAALAAAGLTQFVTVTTDYWHPYQQGIRQGRTGVYLAAPHFVAWAHHQHNFIPFLRLSSPLQYVIATRHEDSQYFELRDLAEKNVCSTRAVNLDFLLVKAAFHGVLKPANNKFVNSVASAMEYDNQNCAAFVVSEQAFKAFNAEDPQRFIRLYQGPEYQNYAFIVHPEVPRQLALKLKKFLRTSTAMEVIAPVLSQFASKPELVPVKRKDYPGTYAEILKPYWQSNQPQSR
ncbi:hypothetical protein GCM10008090_11660 [Arenicella chitinivorans]|uniref:Uncharacterized protein n=1 Tax=Arenicella chitinivorans TaxID=1329800 RepID=A0A918VKL8_9GAMM|nr:PhnD/SsuA/transferrin family substrate-binding protein [Arenicella chitinivorans]GHA04036.1 hypothetical protein GCM10008090_11660 [Arenicella chitinivorans]